MSFIFLQIVTFSDFQVITNLTFVRSSIPDFENKLIIIVNNCLEYYYILKMNKSIAVVKRVTSGVCTPKILGTSGNLSAYGNLSRKCKFFF